MQFTTKIKIHTILSLHKWSLLYEVRLGAGKTVSELKRITLTSKWDIAGIQRGDIPTANYCIAVLANCTLIFRVYYSTYTLRLKNFQTSTF